MKRSQFIDLFLAQYPSVVLKGQDTAPDAALSGSVASGRGWSLLDPHVPSGSGAHQLSHLDVHCPFLIQESCDL